MLSKFLKLFWNWNISNSEGGKVDENHIKQALYPQCCGYSNQSTHKYQEKTTKIENTTPKVNATIES